MMSKSILIKQILVIKVDINECNVMMWVDV